VWLALIAFGALGCDRTHMSASYGQMVRHAFSVQVNDHNAGIVRKTDQPLDPEESAIVADTYRRSLSPTREEPNMPRGELLVLPAPAGGAAAAARPGR